MFHKMKLYFLVLSSVFVILLELRGVRCSKQDPEHDQSWKKKDVRDYSDADLERLYEQWEEDDEPLEEDELPEWKRPRPQIDLSKLDPNDPESLLSMTKKGQTLMMFASVSGDPVEAETEEVTRLWQSSLFNAHYDTQRYVVASNRVLFMLKDGAKAWEVKEFLIQQERCLSVTIEGKDYHGKASPEYQESNQKKSTAEKSKKKSKVEERNEL